MTRKKFPDIFILFFLFWILSFKKIVFYLFLGHVFYVIWKTRYFGKSRKTHFYCPFTVDANSLCVLYLPEETM